MRIKIVVAALIVLFAAMEAFYNPVHAQVPVVYSYETVPAGGTVANCPGVVAGVTAWCRVASGEFQSVNGGAWTSMTPTAAIGGVATVNGKKPDSSGNVALAATTTLN